MLLSSVILVLQETMEVALLFSILAAVGQRLGYRMTWMPYGLVGGFFLAVLYAVNMGSISGWFDYAGQEALNAFAQVMIAGFLILIPWAIFSGRRRESLLPVPYEKHRSQVFLLMAFVMLTLAISREGSEIFVYLGGFLQQEDKLQTVLIGCGIGFSIGISVGFLLFCGLVGLPVKWGIVTPVFLLALFAGNMLSQSIVQLTQADWLPSAKPLWDTSALLPENSISGQLLYALIGYESNPSLDQVVAYLAGMALVLLSSAAAHYHSTRRFRET